MDCVSDLILKIHFYCGVCYTGQIKRCLNDGISEHKGSVQKKGKYFELPKHLAKCNNCVPLFHIFPVVSFAKNVHKRLVKECHYFNHGN